MHILDWTVIALPLVIILIIGIIAHRQMKSVAHFISGGRVGGRYLLAVARGELQAGAVVFVALWEMFSKSGFVPFWWGMITAPVGYLVAIFGFVIYRFRETKAMTLAEFFEMRYSRNFRSFTGVLGFLAGVINFGIIPAVGARFMVYFMQLPPDIHIGAWVVPTYVPIMAVLLSVSLILTLSGGLITLMVTDCLEGIFSQLIYIVLIIGVLWVIPWHDMAATIADRPPNHSVINPFDAWAVQDFNLWYVLMGVFLSVYGTMAWQNSSAYNSAGATPHEARMGGLLGRWREMGKGSVIVLLATGALAFIHNPDYAAQSEAARHALAGIDSTHIQKQMEIPVALSYLLPIGIKGALCAVLLMGIFGGDSTHLHSWGSILAQDVILPRLKRPPTPKRHILLLRCCITGVAIFAFLFGTFFRTTEYIVMWFNVTIAVYVGGAGAAIIGGLYWKKGTSAGAWTAMITGSILSGGGIFAYKLFGDNFLAKALQGMGLAVPDFNLNGMQISFFSTLIAIFLYIVVSLLTCRQDYPLNKMLHREESAEGGVKTPAARWTWERIIGVDEHFTRGDRWIAGGLVMWSLFWLLIMVVGTAWNLIGFARWVPWIEPWSNQTWLSYWHITCIGLAIVITVVTAIWFTWGGFHDIRALFRSLKAYKVDDSDNGRVKRHEPY